MSGAPITTVNGLSLGPLDFESTISVFTRFYWFNAMRPPTIANVGRNVRFAPLVELPHALESCEERGRLVLRAWINAGKEEQQFIEAGDGAGQMAHNVRFCPLCLESCYHSYLFQWLRVPTCPIHGCLLTSRCMQCGEPAPMHIGWASIGRHPYSCWRCKLPLGGAAPSLAMHLDLRAATAPLVAAMQPVAAEWTRAQHTIQLLSQLPRNFQYQRKSNEIHWCNGDAFLRCAAEALDSRGAMKGAAHARGVTSIFWPIPVDRASCTPRHKCRGCSYGCRGPSFNPSPIYIATREILKNWILSTKFAGVSAITLQNYEHDFVDRPLREGNPLCAAYVLLRAICELASWKVEGHGELVCLTPAICHASDAMWCQGRRCGYRAILLCLFSILHSTVTERSDLTLRQVMRRIRMFGGPLPALSFVENGQRWGAVFFPTISGMPLPPFFKKSPKSVP